ncbi:hypothetical protein B6I21_01870 [candidate division KSB1 bacterium 4572_119]|nr:MAG: hypothetical protein B6I21_01870 [candidate division KSB1 bacterium 4572_119]
MKKCHKNHLVVDYFFDELVEKDKEQFRKHLDCCEVCSASLAALSETAPIIKEYKRQLPDKKLMRLYKTKLKEKFYRPLSISSIADKLFRSLIIKPSIPLRLAEAGALILIGVIIGRMTFWKSSPNIDYQTNGGYEILLSSDGKTLVDNYLLEAEMLLLDVSNLNPLEDEQVLINLKQLAMYRSLLQKTLLCRERAEKLDDEKLLTLIDQIEPILLDLCNLEQETLDETVSELRFQIRESHLLFELKTMNQEKI